MARTNKKAELMESAMMTVAEIGFTGFSMKKVTQRIDVSETLIYRHFDTKENLLFCCYDLVNRQIAEQFEKVSIDNLESPEQITECIRDLWMTYFNFMVKNGYRTIYYLSYRRTFPDKVEEAHKADTEHFGAFTEAVAVLDAKLGIFQKIPEKVLWTYILDVTGLYACRVIDGILPNNKNTKNAIWNMIWGGLSQVIEE